MPAGVRYKGEDGGLYGGGLNGPPPAHRLAALRELEKVQPLDAQGTPAPDGRIVFISVGMSNTTQAFEIFKQAADADPQKSSKVTIVDGAQGGRDAESWANTDVPWQVLLEERLPQNGVTALQVQVAWVKLAFKEPVASFPAEAKKLQGYMATIMPRLKEHFPNLRIVHLSSRTYAGYATVPLNPEPHAYESAFAVRWLIQDQMNGNSNLNYDPGRGPVRSPLLLWGPYLWADGLSPRGDGLVWRRDDFISDGTHPSITGRRKVAIMLLKFLKTNELAQSWFLE
jgi:hypothetical protein